MHLHNNQAVLTQDNKVEIFTDGREKFDALLLDIEQAKDHIHIQYYIFRLDSLGQQIYQAVLAKAKQGVKVRILYDDTGSRSLRKRHFKELIELGGRVEAFFPSIFPTYQSTYELPEPPKNCRNRWTNWLYRRI